MWLLQYDDAKRFECNNLMVRKLSFDIIFLFAHTRLSCITGWNILQQGSWWGSSYPLGPEHCRTPEECPGVHSKESCKMNWIYTISLPSIKFLINDRSFVRLVISLKLTLTMVLALPNCWILGKQVLPLVLFTFCFEHSFTQCSLVKVLMAFIFPLHFVGNSENMIDQKTFWLWLNCNLIFETRHMLKVDVCVYPCFFCLFSINFFFLFFFFFFWVCWLLEDNEN